MMMETIGIDVVAIAFVVVGMNVKEKSASKKKVITLLLLVRM